MQDFSAASASAQVAQRERRMRRVERDDGGQARRRYGGGHPFRRVRAGVPAGRTTSRSTLFSVAHPGEGGRSEEHTSELQSLMRISYAVFCLKKNRKKQNKT